jgi:isopenicillin N synthase-like dioxygenase
MTVTDLLPVLDLEAYRAGEPGACDEVAAELRAALEEVGFFSIVGHGVDWALVEDIYGQAARYHDLSDQAKRAQAMTPRRMGYNSLGGESIEGRAPSLNAALFLARPGSARNQWPDEAVLPGFRASCSAYYEAMDRFCHAWLLPLFARALDLAPGYFQPFFDPSLATLRLSHYPAVPAAEDQWGIDPHTDAGFMTLLPANPVDGLEIRPASGDWWEVRQEPRSFVVNSGDMLRRWSNDRLRSTLHRALNRSGQDRYAIPFFYDPRVDTVIECLPTCTAGADPARHPPIVYRDYLTRFMGNSYTALRSGEPDAGGRNSAPAR